MKVCVFSGSTENLNTSMKIKLEDGSTVEVWISDKFAEDASPKTAREAYLKSRSTINAQRKELEEMAAKLGLKIVDESQRPAEPQPQMIKQVQAPQIQPSDPNSRIISGKAADRNLDVSVTTGDLGAYSGQVGGVLPAYQISTQSKPSQDLKEGEVAEVGLVRGRGGADIAIPVRRIGKTGVTNIRVVETGGDRALQDRFKSMANSSKNGDVKHYGREGYDVQFRQCMMCNGTGVSMKQQCPKCKGLGEIQIAPH